jgi:hypothetical protein
MRHGDSSPFSRAGKSRCRRATAPPPSHPAPPSRRRGRRCTDARSTIDEVRDRLRIMGGLPKIRTPGAQTGRCARRRATITACPVSGGIGGGQRDHSARSSTANRQRLRRRISACAQPGGVGLPLPAAGDAPDCLRLHHTGRRTVAATPAAVPSPSVTAGAAEVKTRRRPRR